MKLGLLTRKQRWGLSLRGKLLVLCLFIGLVLVVRWEAYPFLALNRPVNGEVLVLEGWVPLHVLNQAAAEFQRGHYRRVLIIRTLHDAKETYVADRRYDEYLATNLAKHGVPRELVDTLFCPEAPTDRTFHMALAVKEWFAENGLAAKPFNVATLGPHARRSWMMYKKAFGGAAGVGIVPLMDGRYEPDYWWRTTEGVQEITFETIGYLYARLFFSWT